MGCTSIWLLYVVAFLLGIGEAVYDNASQSLVPRLVPDRQLETANGALVTAERVGQDLVGPAVAGVLFTVTVVLPFGLNAVLLAVAGVLLIGIRTEAPRLGNEEASSPRRWPGCAGCGGTGSSGG